MKSAKTLITASVTAAVALTVLSGGVASASTGGSGHKHGHCHHTKHGRGHAYGHRNHDHSCTPTSDPSPSTTIPADTTPSTTVPVSVPEPSAGGATSPISRPGADIVIIEVPAPETSETSLPTETIAPRPDETPTEVPATSPVITTAPVMPGEMPASESVTVTTPENADNEIGSPDRDVNAGMPVASAPGSESQATDDSATVQQNFMGIGANMSMWWLVVLLAVAAETMRRLRKARDHAVESADIA